MLDTISRWLSGDVENNVNAQYLPDTEPGWCTGCCAPAGKLIKAQEPPRALGQQGGAASERRGMSGGPAFVGIDEREEPSSLQNPVRIALRKGRRANQGHEHDYRPNSWSHHENISPRDLARHDHHHRHSSDDRHQHQRSSESPSRVRERSFAGAGHGEWSHQGHRHHRHSSDDGYQHQRSSESPSRVRVSDFATAGHGEVPLIMELDELDHARDHAPKRHGRRTSQSPDRGGRTQSPERTSMPSNMPTKLEEAAIEAMREFHYTQD